MKQTGSGKRRVLFLAAAAVCAALAVLLLCQSLKPAAPRMNWDLVTAAAKCMLPSCPIPSSPPPEEGGTSAPEDDLPHHKLFITAERKNYQNGDLTLIIPKLGIDAPVWSGTTDEDLKNGACLYDYAQLPGEGNRNVSIAAHRNGIRNGVPNDSALFYYVDTLGEGDYLYLADQEHIYRYLFERMYVVDDTDWGPIYSQGYSCLTLTTCTPIGGATPYRLVVRGKLDEIFPYSGTFDYRSCVGATAESGI